MALTDGSDRLLGLLNGERVYRPPFWEVWFGMHEFFTRRYGDYGKVENRIKMAKDLGMAIVSLGGVGTGVGFAKNEETSMGISRYAGGGLRRLKQLEERELPNWDENMEQWKHDQGLIKDSGFISWVILPWCFHAIATSMGLKNFVVRVYDDFDFVDRAFEWVEERNRVAIDAVIREVRPDVVLFDGDCSYKTGLMINPKLFRRLVFERTKETVSHLKRLKIPYVFHTDGKLDDVIPLLIELGFSLVHGCEKLANDLSDLVTRFGDDIVLAGNMDIGFLSRASPEVVFHETRLMLETGSRKGRFVAACNTSPMDFIPDENYLAMVDAIKAYSR